MSISLTVHPAVDRIARLMTIDPQLIQPLLLIEQQGCLTGQLKLSSMHRLLDILCVNNNGWLGYQLEFGKDEESIAYIKGKFRVVLSANCQRCMTHIDIVLNNAISMGIVLNRAEADRLPERYEPLIMLDNSLPLITFFEDEVILGLPMTPLHKYNVCPSRKITEQHATVKENHFAVLKDLKLKK